MVVGQQGWELEICQVDVDERGVLVEDLNWKRKMRKLERSSGEINNNFKEKSLLRLE